MSHYIGYFFEDSAQAVALLAVMGVWIGFTALGAACGGRMRLREIDHLIGWALVSFLFTLAGVFLHVPFTALAGVAAVCAAVGAIVAWRRERAILPPGIGRMIVLGIPLLLTVAAMRASQWDEFTDWLVIPRYLLEVDAFPSSEHPFSKATFSGYPYNWHFVSYLAGRLGGRLLESAGALSNVLLLFGFGLLVARLVLMGAGRYPEGEQLGWRLAAFSMLAVTLFNPTFAQKIVLTAYAETPSAVAVGTSAVLAWFMLEALAGREYDRARGLALSMGLVLALLINLKQATMVLAALVVLAALFVALRDRTVPLGRFIRLLPAIIGPAAVIYLAWRYHLASELTVRELSVRPFSGWYIDLIPQILAKMLVILSKKGVYLALAVIVVGLGLRGFWRSQTPLDRFAALAAMIFLGYNAFLLFAYVATFGEKDALRAASYWRYNMHLGALLVAFAGYGLALLWRTRFQHRFRPSRFGWLAVVLIVAAPFVFVKKLRFDREPMTAHFRVVGAGVAELAHLDDVIFNIDPLGSGESSAALTFELGERARFGGHISAFSGNRLQALKDSLARPNVNALIVHSSELGYEDVLGVETLPGRSYFLRRDDGGNWRIVKSWPQPRAE